MYLICTLMGCFYAKELLFNLTLFYIDSFSISAISLSEIENDPIRYVKVYEVMDETGCYYTGSMYVDKDSVEVLLCAPPL